MRKFLLFITLLIFSFSFVYADELPSCYSDYLVDYSIGNHTYIPLWNKNNQTWTYVSSSGQNNSKPLQVLIPLYADKSTYLKFPVSASGNNINIWGAAFYDENLTYTNSVSQSSYVYDYISYSYDNTTNILIITPLTSTYSYTSLGFSTMLSWNNFNRPVPWGSQTSGQLAIADFDLVECPTPPEPPTSPTNAIYDSFLTIFTDRLSFLAINFTSNPYLFTFIGIIFAWIILELFLRIFHIRGGYKK